MRPLSSSSPAGQKAVRPLRLLVPGLAVALAAATLWAGATTYCLFFRDDLIARAVSQQRAMQADYEERVGALQAQAERAASQRVLTRDGLDARLAALDARQALLEKRQGQLADLAITTSGAIGDALPASPKGTTAPLAKQPSPTPELPDLRIRGGDRAEAPDRPHAVRMTELDLRLDDVAEHQRRTLSTLTAQSLRNADRLRSVVLRAGLQPTRYEKPVSGVGGPLVAIRGDAFDIALAEARRASGSEEYWRGAVEALPLRKPLQEAFAFTSDFGMRADPFTRGLGLHTGVDMRADYGVAVRAAASGRVTAAEPNGGYGNMVEVDHGYGIATRYAHLSGFAVTPGQWVEAGTVLGRVGSTGRSTGNHLHYETRIDGEPVDPQPFLRLADDSGSIDR